ncbi:RNA-directed DNA polymerase, eukaryota [Tanacetum coccineum]
MGAQSNEDHTMKISKSVFVTNFPEGYSAHDLWKVCSDYGTVVDVFIPFKKSKAGKRFAFVRFIKVINLDRLVENLRTIWIGRFHLHANAARFQRPTKPFVSIPKEANMGIPKKPVEAVNTTFVNVLKSNNFKPNHVIDSTHVIVLDDSCLFERDFSLSLMGKIKDINAMSNLYFILANEGFENVKLSYLGGMWVLLEMDSIESKEKIIKHVGVGSWFYELRSACNSFVTDERVIWISVEGLPIKAFTRNAFAKIVCIKTKPRVSINEKLKVIVKGRIHWIRLKELQAWYPDFKPVNEDINSSDEDSECNFDDNNSDNFNSGEDDNNRGNFNNGNFDDNIDHVSKSSCMYDNKRFSNSKEHSKKSEDPFEIYKILNRNKDSEETGGEEPKFPPGFTPIDVVEDTTHDDVVKDNVKENGSEKNSNSKHSVVNNKEGFSSVHMESSIASKFKTGGSILEVMEELITLGQTIGLGNKAKKGWIQELNSKHRVNFVAIQETKMEKIDLFSIKALWGNFCFDHAFCPSIGFSGGILCVWDPRLFVKDNVTVLDSFLAVSGIYLSDHRPILLPELNVDYGPSPFCFFHSWFHKKGFDNLVEITWKNAVCMETNAIVKLKKKLQALKIAIKQWVKDDKLQSSASKMFIQSRLVDLDKIIDQGKGNEEVISDRSKLLKDLSDLNASITTDLAQKAKIHGDWIDDPSYVKNKFLKHFCNRFAAPLTPKLFFQSQFPNRVTPEQIDVLESIASYDEIKRAAWDYGINKSPGLDGSFPTGCNSSFIVLIPKTQDPKMVKDFRPISLIGSMYKIIAKILANRLSLVISNLISDVQSAFVSNHQILDGPFILNELISWCKHKNTKAMIFKVDFEKAFDSVRWDFLDEVLKKIGFGDKWRSWIQGCLSSSMGSILVNGSPTSEFKFYKGLKQGDPLSPFLFILIMESLHILFENVLYAGPFKGIQFNDSLCLSHLFYADDVVFVGKWDTSNFAMIVKVLKWFFLAFRLKINIHKSKLMGISIPHDVVVTTTSSIGCLTLSTPFNYLGVKVGGFMARLSS